MTSVLPHLAPMTLVGFVLFTAAWVVLGLISTGFTLFGQRVEPYNWVAQPVSGLGLGNTATAMNSAFVLTGTINAIGVLGICACVPGLTGAERILAGAILMVSPIGTALAGVFTLERFLPHFGGYLLATGAPVIGFPTLGWLLMHRSSNVATGVALIGAGALTLVLLVLQLRSFDPEASGRGEGVGGLTQRILITEVLGVFAILGSCVHLMIAP